MADKARSSNAAVQAQLDRLAALSPGRDVLGLERITALLTRLGDPQLALPPVFHVAGTNGKGSTCAFLRAMLESGGRRVHAYTSPHLVRFNERIRLSGTLIDDDDLATTLARVLDVADGLGASFFEITTVAALLRFAEQPADACVIEVGLGGRLDATNVIPSPVVCGIASLGIDHEAFLLAPESGTPDDPLCRIAWEKAGIAKAGVPLVVQSYTQAMTGTIADVAAQHGAPLIARGAHWDSRQRGGMIHYRDALGEMDLPVPTMAGAHQADNVALAVAMLRHQQAITLTDDAIADGVTRAHWPARLQLLDNGPLHAIAPHSMLWLDGGHNPDAAIRIAAHFAHQPKGIDVIIGMLSNKDAAQFIAILAPIMRSLTAVPIPDHECHTPETLTHMARAAGIAMTATAPDVSTALQQLAPNAPNSIAVLGSLYLAGDVLSRNGQLPA